MKRAAEMCYVMRNKAHPRLVWDLHSGIWHNLDNALFQGPVVLRRGGKGLGDGACSDVPRRRLHPGRQEAGQRLWRGVVKGDGGGEVHVKSGADRVAQLHRSDGVQTCLHEWLVQCHLQPQHACTLLDSS